MCTQGLESELLKMFYRHFYDSFIYTYPILLFSIKLHAKNNKTLGGNNVGEIEQKPMELCY